MQRLEIKVYLARDQQMSDKSLGRLGAAGAFQNINRLTFPTLAGRLNRIDSLVYGTDRKLIKLWSPPNGLEPATQIWNQV